MAARRTKEEIIAELEARIIKLKVGKIKKAKLTKQSEGVSEAISAIENAAAQNDISVVEIIKLISRIKRTGLRFEDAEQLPD